MTSKLAPARPFSLRRWSQRKLEAAREQAQTPPPAPPAVMAAPLPAAETRGARAPQDPVAPDDTPLPPIESLTIDSDFAPFFKPEVDEQIKRAALKQLFRDPRFNIMDGLDTYIDDYTQPDPIPAAMLADLMQRRVCFAFPADTDSGARVVDEPAGDRAALAAGEVARPDAQIEHVAPVAPPDTARDDAQGTIEAERKSGIETEVRKP